MSVLAVRSIGVRTLSALLGAGALVGLAGGCLFTNTSHCGYKADGADNPCPDGLVCNVCAVANNGCVPASETISDSCRDASGGTTSLPPTSTTESTLTATTSLPPTSTTTLTSTTSTTGPTSTTVSVTMTEPTTETDPTDPTETTGSPNCDPAVLIEDPGCAPLYCVAPGECGPCGELPAGTTCASLLPDLPLCDPESGQCAECTADDTSACPANAPICAAGLCAPCTEHSQCESQACDIEEGVCFPEDMASVFYVKGDEVGCGGKDGKTPATAFCTLGEVPLTAAKTTIRMLLNNKPPGRLDVTNKVVALISHQQERPEISGQNLVDPTVEVSGAGARVYLSGIKFRIAPAAPSVLSCGNQGTLHAHDVWITGNNIESPPALAASACKVRIQRALIVGNGAGIQVTGGDLVVASSFIMDNGNSGQFGAFNLVNDPKARITYSTILSNAKSTFSCMGITGEVELRNSAVVGLDLAASTCGILEGDQVTVNGGLISDDLGVIAGWFLPKQVNIFIPREDEDLKDTAQWKSGDPRVDFSGIAIPTGAPSYAGARQP